MEFNDLLTKDAHEEGAEVEIKDASTGKGLGFYITVLGMDSEAFQVGQKRARGLAVKARIEGKELSEADEIKQEIEILSGISVGWRGIETNGDPKPFSQEECAKLYDKSPAIRRQVDEFLYDRENFTKG